MSDSILNIIINTVKKGGGDKETVTGLKKLSASFKELTGFSLGSVTAIGAVTGVATGLYKVMKGSVDTYVQYANAVRTVRDETTLTSEEASRIIQLMDDYKLSTDDVIKSQKFLAQEGKSLSVDTLAKMSDAYLELNSGAEKTNYLSQNLGKNGSKYAEILSKGSAEIYKQADAISEKLILDDAALKKARDLEIAQDNLNDKWMEFQVSIGPGVATRMTALINLLLDLTGAEKTAARSAADFMNDIWAGTALETRTHKELRLQLEDEENARLANQEAQEGLNERLNEYKTIMGGAFGNEIEKFNGQLADQKDKAAEIRLQIDELNGKSWLTPEQKQQLADLKQNLIDNTLETWKLQQEHERTMKEMAMNMLITKASSDGLKDNEVNNIATIMQQWGLWDEKTATVVQNLNAINLDDANLEINSVNQALGNIFARPDEKRIKVITEYITEYLSGNAPNNEYITGDTAHNPYIGNADSDEGPHGANGLDFIVPPGFPNDSYKVWAESGERVQVTPAGQSGGGNITNYFQISGAGDPDAVANRVMQKLKLQLGTK